MHLAQRGKLSDLNNKIRAELAPGDLDLPQNLRLVIGRRLNRISDETRGVLATAAVIGRSFPFTLLQATTHTDPDSLLDRVEEAEAAGLLTSTLQYPERSFTPRMNSFAKPSSLTFPRFADSGYISRSPMSSSSSIRTRLKTGQRTSRITCGWPAYPLKPSRRSSG